MDVDDAIPKGRADIAHFLSGLAGQILGAYEVLDYGEAREDQEYLPPRPPSDDFSPPHL